MAEILFKNISKVYSNNEKAVDNFSMKIEDKEFVVLVGPSGCGKSTTLRMIAGLEEISGGDMYIGDRRINDVAPKDRDIAIVFQNYALYPHMTAYDNLAFGLKIKRVKKKEIHERVMQAANILEIADLLEKKPGAMSGGQRQRIAIGRAIVRNPKVFLFDEPLSNLDAKLRVQMRFEISKLHKKLDTTVVYVTHDQVEAMTLGDRIVVMDKGIIQQIDTPTKLYSSPDNLFVAGFIGSPQMNLIEGNITKKGEELIFEDENRLLKVSLSLNHPVSDFIDKNIVLGIRPEDISNSINKDENNYALMNTKIQFIEQLGHEVYVFCDFDEKQIVARFKSEKLLLAGHDISLYLDKNKMHFFDPESKKAIR